MAPPPIRRAFSADADLVYRTLVWFGQSRSLVLAGELSLSHDRVLTALSTLHAARLVTYRGDGLQRRWSVAAQSPATGPGAKPAAGTSAVPVPAPRPHPAQFQALADVQPLGDDLRHLPSRAAAQRRLDAIYRQRPHELLSISPEDHWDARAFEAAARASHWMARSGTAIRELGVATCDLDLLVPFGGLRLPDDSYRRMSSAPMKLIVFDRRIAFFPVDPANLERGYLEVSQAPVVESLVGMFERHWAEAGRSVEAGKPVEDAMSGFELSPREQAVVEQLVLGHTDATAAQALHISERTVSGIVGSLMERLDVRNRFQLGVALGKLDAAPLPPPAGRGRGDNEGQRSRAGT